MPNRTLTKSNKFNIPNQFTIKQTLDLLYIIILKQFENLKTKFARIEEGSNVNFDDVTKLYKYSNSLLIELDDSIGIIEDYFKCDDILNRNLWANSEISSVVDDFLVLDEDIRIVRLNCKEYIMENKTQSNLLQMFNSLGVSKLRVRKDEEEESYVFREAEKIRRDREIFQTNKIKQEREAQQLLEKTIEVRIRSELQKEFDKKLDDEKRKLINKYSNMQKVSAPAPAPAPAKSKSVVRQSKSPPVYIGTDSIERSQTSKISRKSLDVSRVTAKQSDNNTKQRTSFDIHEIGRAARLAWTSSSSIDPTNTQRIKRTHLPKRSKSSDTIKSNYEAIKLGIHKKPGGSQTKGKLRISTDTSNRDSRRLSSPTVRARDVQNIANSVTDIDARRKFQIEEENPTPKTDLEIKINKIMNSLVGVDKASCELIINNILVQNDVVHWDDIAGLSSTKEALKEAVEYPFLRPDLFKGLREPIRGLLLFGPPGTGKTMIAKAVACESNSTFFSISASSLLSKYLGESEKLVKALFYLAKRLAPSIIFIDEIDSLLTSRSDNENESSRRIKTELLIQWSSISKATANDPAADEDDSRVLVLAATNLPWDIDEAARRRFSRRLYIPLPGPETRLYHLKKLLSSQKHNLTEENFSDIAQALNGYSGSDITALAKEAAMGPIRELDGNLLNVKLNSIRGVTVDDFVNAMETTKKSVSQKSIKDYQDWSSKFGSSGD